MSLVAIIVLVAIVSVINATFTRDGQNRDVILEQQAVPSQILPFTLSSPSFEAHQSIPAKYTCDEGSLSVPLSIAHAPTGTKSFAIVMEDPYVPKNLKPDGVFLHWTVFNVPATTTEITEGARVGVYGANGAGQTAYAGPCPPPQYEPSEHRYVFTLYALDTELALVEGAAKDAILNAMTGHILGQAELVGKYKRK